MIKYDVDWVRACNGIMASNNKDSIDRLHKNVFKKFHEEIGKISIAPPYFIKNSASIDITGSIVIKPFFCMNDNTVILRHFNNNYQEIPFFAQGLSKTIVSETLNIEEDVVMLYGSVILPKVTFVHKGTILAVGTILTKNTDCEYGIWAGNPAMMISKRPKLNSGDLEDKDIEKNRDYREIQKI